MAFQGLQTAQAGAVEPHLERLCISSLGQTVSETLYLISTRTSNVWVQFVWPTAAPADGDLRTLTGTSGLTAKAVARVSWPSGPRPGRQRIPASLWVSLPFWPQGHLARPFLVPEGTLTISKQP